ncbi:MAG: tRNA 2-selenouridine(34) synthase MnmH [Rhodocyclaceae bacterium]|nr:tRNA 2-selenouridine(34) synthase MnmH [Rhodocyclaceae bacterium]
MKSWLATVAQLAEFETVIDVRSPAEFAADHIPGAINCPVLDDAERARVGTLYIQVSPFEARKVGAALVARNIARHIEERFLDRPKSWRPLIYCWRGGQRSGAFTHILREIGWAARRLDGGYKAWRRHVLDRLESLPGRLDLRVIGGPTGSGKTRLLEALAAQGAQVVNLEALAAHKGSVLGDLPDQPQPSQKMFETHLMLALTAMDSTRPVYVEAESRRIGALYLPNRLFDALRAAPVLRIEADLEARVDFLLQDYAHLLAAADGRLAAQLARLHELQSKETIARWQRLATAGNFRLLVGELLTEHYDPLYRRSQPRGDAGHAPLCRLTDLSDASLKQAAAAIIAAEVNIPDRALHTSTELPPPSSGTRH